MASLGVRTRKLVRMFIDLSHNIVEHRLTQANRDECLCEEGKGPMDERVE